MNHARPVAGEFREGCGGCGGDNTGRCHHAAASYELCTGTFYGFLDMVSNR